MTIEATHRHSRAALLGQLAHARASGYRLQAT